ncbi:universal stress protein [Pyrinomonas methylaliphatogenes]|jgi:nucleotide-binding universal stress UspA family protein|uniref:Universal stress protein UspA-like protein n=1 Tax=Pyrinomonas methylaliphatogenes TaxID=454194 RepID=A0A0B6WY70_9BACT|nr:universal stress protein [Pyrinomonas methylaliphatogenes]CDM66056.1 universal stress protein UspA-like protein [Pyrinomonas methylaliphatogenes]
MLQRILVAFDGSEQSRKAFDLGLEIADRFRAKLLVVSVIQLPEPATSVEIAELLDREQEHLLGEMAHLRKRAEEFGIELETHIAAGHPAEQIIRYAEDCRADMIIMGRRGRTRVTRWILGSISERVLRYAHCPVTVIK